VKVATDPKVDLDVLEYVRANPGSTSVDVFLSWIVPGAEGTFWIIPILRRLAEAGKIVPVRSSYADHVRSFPGMHEVGAPLLVEQATKWVVS
jgi:hypothetical protein